MENQQGNQTPTPPTPSSNTGYSTEYVKELRDEAASWRTKLRDTENRLTSLEADIAKNVKVSTIKEELSKRNLNIDVDFIKLEQGDSASTAVDNFLKKYPQFGEPTVSEPTRKPLPPNKRNTNAPAVINEDYAAVKKDPIARTKLRELYRSMLADRSNITI